MSSFSSQRFFAYLIKESKQVTRDPSTILIAFVLPLLMIFIFGYGVSLDANKIPIGLVMEDMDEEARSLASAFMATSYFDVQTEDNTHVFKNEMTLGKLRAVVIIPQNFSRLLLKEKTTPIQILLDGSEPNTAKFALNYATDVINTWMKQRAIEHKSSSPILINPEPRVWFNAALKSRDVLLPGSMATIMSLIGTLLTALVVAREWERGTMETIMATPLRTREMLLAKLIPYFCLGIGSMILCVTLAIFLFGVPFRGSFFVLLLATAVFLLASLGQGLLISSTTRNQFVSSQIAIMLGFLPAFVLSGFIFEINSMPWPIRAFTYLFPPRYFVPILQSTFLSGTPWELVLPNLFAMFLIALFFFFITTYKTSKRLDS